MTFDISAARSSLKERQSKREQSLFVLAREAQADCDRIVDMLIRDFSPRRIWQWGSLLKPETFREWSDVDLAVEGLSDPLAGLRALDAACRLTRFPVDLIELERAHPRHATTIRNVGKLIYEQT